MKKITILSLLFILVFFSAWKNVVDPHISEILKKADFHRGGQIKGITWDLNVRNVVSGNLKNELSLLVEASSLEERQFALVTFLQPTKYKGQKLLIRDNNMWFSKIDLRRPVAISSRQRLSGSAANADVASANYFNDYSIENFEETTIDKDPCWTLSLVAKNSLVPYSKIKYSIRKRDNAGIKAEFFGTSQKLIKVATFQYDNKALYNGASESFVSKIIINDSININDVTTLTISNIRFEDFDNSKFQKDRLQD